MAMVVSPDSSIRVKPAVVVRRIDEKAEE